MSDVLFIDCPRCDERIASRRVEDGERLPTWLAIRWHERAVAHLRRVHLRGARTQQNPS